MKDEIKEIKISKSNHSIVIIKNGVTVKEQFAIDDEILDYITNLQQIEQGHQKLNGELREENKKLQEENERLRKQNTEYQDEIFARDNNWYDMQD